MSRSLSGVLAFGEAQRDIDQALGFVDAGGGLRADVRVTLCVIQVRRFFYSGTDFAYFKKVAESSNEIARAEFLPGCQWMIRLAALDGERSKPILRARSN